MLSRFYVKVTSEKLVVSKFYVKVAYSICALMYRETGGIKVLC